MATEGTPPPPLERILPYVVSLFSASLSVASAFTRFTTVLITNCISFFSPIPILAYLFAPVIVLLDVIVDVCIRWPHHIALSALDALYPIYVFCGVACIVGALLGITGRLVVLFLVDVEAGRVPAMPTLAVSVPVIESKVKKGKKPMRRKREQDEDD